MALARDAYSRDRVRIIEHDVADYSWIVASHRGVFAVKDDRVLTVIYGWFFGICRHENQFYLFENGGLRDRFANLGRIIRIDLIDGKLANPVVLASGLDGNCHQIRVIDGLLCLVDTANQAIRRHTLAGDLVDIKRPFPIAPPSDQTGAYLHINGIAKIGSRIAIMRHNGKALPEKNSEIAWLDADWNLVSCHELDGRWCHDIVEDERGTLWHCGSQAGEIFSSDGQKIAITDDMLTRGLAISRNRIIVGKSTFGPREVRHSLLGGIVILDREYNRIADMPLDGPPADIAAI